MMRPAYAVEYDYLPAASMHERFTDEKNREPVLLWTNQRHDRVRRSRRARFSRGCKCSGESVGNETINFGKRGSYLGTLIDDLVTKDLRTVQNVNVQIGIQISLTKR